MKIEIKHACVIILLVWPLLASLAMAGSVTEKGTAGPETIHQRLTAKNPHYNGQAQFANEPGLGLVGDLSGTGITDLSPLKGVPFGALDLRGLPISNIDPLRDMPLKALALEDTKVTDLKPLKGMKLEKLYLNNTAVTDLAPLAGMPLKELQLVGTKVRDLGPLRGEPIEQLWLNDTPVTTILPLAGCPLVSLTLEGTKVSDLTPLSKMTTLRRLHIAAIPVHDLTPLQGLTLTRLIFTPPNITKGMDVVRAMKSLTEVGTSLDTRMPPAQFWLLYDQGKAK